VHITKKTKVEYLQLIFGHEDAVVSTTTLQNKPNQRVSFHCLPFLVVVRHFAPIVASYSQTFKCRQQAECQICVKCFRWWLSFGFMCHVLDVCSDVSKECTAFIFSKTESGLNGC